ncbi:MAG: RNA-binding transcriptional accessory protein [Defluviitaleaceae bacterium]|nr:RNA-binding transcriptional accessory protein [Defluviitaleaceae bacterium]
MNIISVLAKELGLNERYVENTVKLIDDDNTIPFIARYRKELTGEMDDQTLRVLFDRLTYLRNLEDRKAVVLKSIEEQGKLTDEIAASLQKAVTLTEVEDIYRPFKPKRRTRATIAIEKGLEPLAEVIWLQELAESLDGIAEIYIDVEKGVETIAEAISGACDILAERISDEQKYRDVIRKFTLDEALITSVKAAKADEIEKNHVYEMYFEFSEMLKKVPNHRILAINRGEDESVLKISIEAPIGKIIASLEKLIIMNNPQTDNILKETITDAYKRLAAPSIEREIRANLTEKAQEGAIKVFGENLKQVLMQPPIKGNIVLAIDPGYRTGCKFAVVDETGKVLDVGIVHCTLPKMDTTPAKRTILNAIKKHAVSLIAIGNGTASRETEFVVAELIKENSLTISYIIVNEAGASVYSASKLGAEEFPNFDVALRSAASIGRRLQDPLAELVKIDPKSIGVGQYQHDMNQKRLGETLTGVVESCVNNIGVDLNTASPSLLSYVSGISSSVAKNILEYREEIGKFTSRKELLKVKKLGPKAFLQCAGFLRIPEAKNPLDNTGVHPESYTIAEKYLELKDKVQDVKEIANTLEVGLPTLKDIIKELEKPGRDPRDELPKPILKNDILTINDLKPGMVLKGTIRNVIDFGVFVDIGVHQDGLVHISQISKRRIKHPLDAVSLGDIVDVEVLEVDTKRNRISLTMKVGNANKQLIKES